MYSTQTKPKPSLATRLAESWKEDKVNFGIMSIAAFFAVGTVLLIVGYIVLISVHVGGIHEGSVVGKDHTPETTSMQCNSYDGKTTICTPVTYPESWNVTIAKGGDKNSFSVSQEKWDTLNEGDYLTFDGESLTSVNAQ
jgi:hypothetical protein